MLESGPVALASGSAGLFVIHVDFEHFLHWRSSFSLGALYHPDKDPILLLTEGGLTPRSKPGCEASRCVVRVCLP